MFGAHSWLLWLLWLLLSCSNSASGSIPSRSPSSPSSCSGSKSGVASCQKPMTADDSDENRIESTSLKHIYSIYYIDIHIQQSASHTCRWSSPWNTGVLCASQICFLQITSKNENKRLCASVAMLEMDTTKKHVSKVREQKCVIRKKR